MGRKEMGRILCGEILPRRKNCLKIRAIISQRLTRLWRGNFKITICFSKKKKQIEIIKKDF